jgi:hypothetical protein
MKIPRLALALTVINLALMLATLAQARPTGAQDTAPLLRARALELIDAHGTLRARLDVESNGEVVFRLLDQKGTIRVKLGAAEDGQASCWPTTRLSPECTSSPNPLAAAGDWRTGTGASGSSLLSGKVRPLRALTSLGPTADASDARPTGWRVDAVANVL